jgi:hypothetical protein
VIDVDFGVVTLSEGMRIITSTGSNLVNADDFACLGVDDGDDGERVSPEVAFAVLAVGGVDQGLHVSAIGVVSCVNDDFKVLGEVELGDALLEDRGVSTNDSDVIKLFAIRIH